MNHGAALARQWLMLSAIPRFPRKVDTATLEAKLRAEGFHVTRRSIQRDLGELSDTFPLECDASSKPYGWSWKREAPAFDLPAMEPRAAVTYDLLDTHLADALPRAICADLQPQVQRARQLLARLDDNPFARWPEKVRFLADGVPERPPHTPECVVDATYDALLHDRQLSVDYRSGGDAAPKTRVVSPLGLVFRGPLSYLVCHDRAREAVLTLLLHRATAARALDAPAHRPPGFDLDAYLASGDLGFLLSEAPIRLVARIRKDAARRLIEAPPGRDPEVRVADDHVELHTTVPDNRPTRAWLLGFGPTLEVLSPPELRAAIARDLREAAARYDR